MLMMALVHRLKLVVVDQWDDDQVDHNGLFQVAVAGFPLDFVNLIIALLLWKMQDALPGKRQVRQEPHHFAEVLACDLVILSLVQRDPYWIYRNVAGRNVVKVLEALVKKIVASL